MTLPIYLLRHGETEWNAIERIQGALDSPLTAKGVAQAKTMGAILKRELRGAVPPLYCSPLGRARRTLEIVCDVAGLDAAACRFDERLREVSWGRWDGLTRAQIEAVAPGALAARAASHWTHRPPGGVSYADLAARVGPFLDDIAGDGGIIVSHGAIGRVVRGLLSGLAPAQMLALAEPQDVVFKLQDGRCETLRAV